MKHKSTLLAAISNPLSIFSALVLSFMLALACCNRPNVSEKDESLFKLLSPEETGVTFGSKAERQKMVRKGVSLGYINEDELIDFCVINDGRIGLYINLGELKFEDISETVALKYDSTRNISAACLIDLNGDNLSDLFIAQSGSPKEYSGVQSASFSGKDQLLLNLGNNQFSADSTKYSLNAMGYNMAYTFLDYDNDNDLDLYMGNRPYDSLGQPIKDKIFAFDFFKATPQEKYSSDRFYENKNGHFVDVSEQAGIFPANNFPNSVLSFDYNNDGFADVFVANDFLGEDFLYRNNGDKTFTRVEDLVFSISSLASMGSDVSDINNDGYQDLYVAEMLSPGNYRQKTNTLPFSYEFYSWFEQLGILKQYQRNVLYLNNQQSKFRDVGRMYGVEATEWSWSPLFADLNRDGVLDLFVTNGFKFDWTNLDFLRNSFGKKVFDDEKSKMSSQPTDYDINSAVKSVYENYTFEGVSNGAFVQPNNNWGITGSITSYGAAIADMDNDGDLDLITNNLDVVVSVYENRINLHQPNGNFIKIRFAGSGFNRRGIGAKLELYQNGTVQFFENVFSRGYFSNGIHEAFFGFGDSTKTPTVDSIKVTWPGGKSQVKRNLKKNQTVTFFESESENPTPSQFNSKTLFKDFDLENIEFCHKESDFNDFSRDRLIHRMLSRESAPISVGDVNNDGLEDVYFGAASGEQGALYLQGQGSFKLVENQPMYEFPQAEETSTVFVDIDNDRDLDLYVASGSNEFSEKGEEQLDRIFVNNGDGIFKQDPTLIPDISSSTCAVSSADFDNDGDSDLFVGGRLIPEKYPLSPNSYLLMNENGAFVDKTDKVAPGLRQIGMVTASLWSDFDNDGDRDLLLVGDWMSLTVFRNEQGILRLMSDSSFRTETRGWWNTINECDLDNDGDLDYVLGNHGSNSFFRASLAQPATMLSADFDNNGSLDPVLFHYIGGVNAPAANRDLFCQQMPFYNNLFYTFDKYGRATFDNLFSDSLKNSAHQLTAHNLNSIWVENTGLSNQPFLIHHLPMEAQAGPVYGIEFCDFNNDGFQDILLVGNSYSGHFQHGNYDALNGLVLKNTGMKSFKAENNCGFSIFRDAKSIQPIEINGKRVFLVGNNNSCPQAFSFGN